MSELNLDWVKEQLTQNKTRKMTGDAVLELLSAWKKIKKPPKTDISEEVVELFSKLALGYALVKEDKNETWVQAQAGDIKIADTIRIKFNAFSETSGKYHLNGRKGKIVGLRYGDIIIKTDDEKVPIVDGLHLRPENVEKKIV